MLFKLTKNQNTYPKYNRINQKRQKQLKYKYETKKISFLFLILSSLYLAVQTSILDLTIPPKTNHHGYSNEDLNYIPMARPTPTPKPTPAR
jgi:hypothetical protein